MKLCVIFPGVGYTTDKPLLFYSRKLLSVNGYDVKCVSYTDLPTNIRDNRELMKMAYDSALTQAEDLLNDVEWNKYSEVLLIGKSIGTVIATTIGKKIQERCNVRYILLTPLEETFLFGDNIRGIAFHGAADPWADTEVIADRCNEYNVPLFCYDNANHSLETGEVNRDLEILGDVIKRIKGFI